MIQNATIFRHSLPDPAGTLLDVLDARRIKVTGIDTFDQSLDGFDPLAPDLLIVMGGSCGVYQAEDYPFLKDEKRILESRLRADRPTLGICLGAQLMAAALGSRVYKAGQGAEIGWHSISVNDLGKARPVRHFDTALTQVMQWHGDTFDLPAGAVLLASSDRYPNQIFQWGRSGLAIQFHPEVTPLMLKYWIVDSAYAAYEGKIDIRQLRAGTERWVQVMQKQTRIFLHEWLDQVGEAV